MYRAIDRCRICKLDDFEIVLSLGDIAISDFTDSPIEGDKVPLNLLWCRRCGLVQIEHTVSRDRLYRRYFYRSSISRTVRDDLKDVVRLAERLVPLNDGDIVLDIAGNDNQLLRSYRKPQFTNSAGLRKASFDPAENLADEAWKGVNQHFVGLWNADQFLEWSGGQKAKVITACAVLYHAEDPGSFVEDVYKCLSPDGVFIVEASHLYSMLEQTAVDSIGHEHLSHLSLNDISVLAGSHGMVVTDAWLRGLNCGVMRAVIRKHPLTDKNPFGLARTDAILEFERRAKELHQRTSRTLPGSSLELFKSFRDRVEIRRREFLSVLAKLKSEGKRVMGIGASTKGAILAQYYGLTPDHIEAIGDPNPDKHNKFCVATKIPVVNMDEMRAREPDVLVCFPWFMGDEMIAQEKEFIERGGKFLMPLPNVELLP